MVDDADFVRNSFFLPTAIICLFCLINCFTKRNPFRNLMWMNSNTFCCCYLFLTARCILLISEAHMYTHMYTWTAASLPSYLPTYLLYTHMHYLFSSSNNKLEDERPKQLAVLLKKIGGYSWTCFTCVPFGWSCCSLSSKRPP